MENISTYAHIYKDNAQELLGAPFLERLLNEKNINNYAFYYWETEGKRLPGGIYEESAGLLSLDGKLYHIWTSWDPEKLNPETGEKTGWYTLGDNKFLEDGTSFFDEFTAEEYEKEKAKNSPEFQKAKKALGLDDDLKSIGGQGEE